MKLAIGDVLKDLRIEKRMKLGEVAQKASIATGFLSQIEKGKKKPSLDVIDRICFALGTPTEHVIVKAGLEAELEDSQRRLYRELEPFFKKFYDAMKRLYNQ